MTDRHDRDRDRQSLRDLAKLSQQTGPLSSSVPASARVMPPPSSGVADNSGLIDLERLSEAIRATTEAQSAASLPGAAPSEANRTSSVEAPPSSSAFDHTPLSPSVEFTEAAAPSTAKTVAEASPAAAAPAPATAVQAPAAAAGGSKMPLVLVAVAALGVGGFLATRKGEAPAPAPAPVAEVAKAEPKVEAPVAAAKPADDKAAEAKPAEAQAAEAKPAEAKIEAKAAEAKPAEAKAAEAKPAEPKAAEAKGGAAKAGAGAKPTEKSFADEMAAAVTGKLQTTQAAEPTAAAGPTGPSASMAKPGTGQISAAFAKVKAAAHGCLGGQEVEVKTTVTFSSDGKVQKVAVANAPDPGVASCIEGAVSKATVPPFTDATFNAPLTVR